MINVSNCNTQAAKLEAAATNLGSVIERYETAVDYLSKNSSTATQSYINEMNTKIESLTNLKKNLNLNAGIIREKARSIYNQEQKEQEAKESQSE